MCAISPELLLLTYAMGTSVDMCPIFGMGHNLSLRFINANSEGYFLHRLVSLQGVE